ncbi:hypothetical protein MMC26_007362 [Xylographa opegraphella]|nr:hypothetical protein [Xylographa opegraphella]
MAAFEVIEISSGEEWEAPLDRPCPASAVRKARPSLGGFVDLGDEFDFSGDAPVGGASASLVSTTTVARAVESDIGDFGFPVPKRRKVVDGKALGDSIVFTSSPRELVRKGVGEECRAKGREEEVDGEISDTVGGQSVVLGSRFSSRTTALLSEIDGNKNRARKKEVKGRREGKMLKRGTGDGGAVARTQSSAVLSTDAEKTKAAARKPRLASAERGLKEREREQARVRKEREREEEKERRGLAKREKDIEKQRAAVLAEVNRSKVDKKLSTPEMIVDLPASIEGQRLDVQVREFLKILGVEVATKDTPVPNVIRWRRKTKSRFNDELGHWEPMPETIVAEKHTMCLLSAKEFASLAAATGAGHADVEGHVRSLKRAFPGCIPIYLIEGLDAWARRAKNSKNRSFQAAVQRQMANVGESSATPQAKASKAKRKQADEAFVDEDVVEDALLRLQVIEGCLVHHTGSGIESAEWIQSFTAHISTIPYKKRRTNFEVSFCMDVGQVKTGDDKDDTFVKMLQEVNRVTTPIAYGIAAEYPSVVSLVAAFKEHGPLALAELTLTPTPSPPEEHHIANFDAGAFFSLHDYDSSGGWTPDEVRRTYGLDDESARDVRPDKREEVTREVYRLFDADKNGIVEREEWMGACEEGVRLPDFGLGPGHHGDDEYEYEIHHFEKFHDENTKEEDLIHPEDIAHFAKHDREEAEAERQEVLNRQSINEANIPAKFRRQ